jgi:T5SS/PEP-CTERM-associated repeat protein
MFHSHLPSTRGCARIIPLAALALAGHALAAGDGSQASPFLNNEVTPATLDTGAAAPDSAWNVIDTGTAANFNASTDAILGNTTSRNRLTVKNGATLSDHLGCLGKNTGADGNLLIVTGAGTKWINSSGLIAGNNGGANAVRLEDGASATSPDCVISGQRAASDNSLMLSGASSLVATGQVYVGAYGNRATLHVRGASTVTATNLCVGLGQENDADHGNGNQAVFLDAGSSFTLTGELTVGGHGDRNELHLQLGATGFSPVTYVGREADGNDSVLKVKGTGSELDTGTLILGATGNNGGKVVVADSALLRLGSPAYSASLSYTPESHICLSGGCFAIYWSSAPEMRAKLADKLFLVWDDAQALWREAEEADVWINTYSLSGDYDSLREVGYNLAGYTIIRGGDSILQWSDSTSARQGWFTGGWYGTLYYDDVTFGHWLWHGAHGWQYVYSIGGGALVLWDCATGAWWYVSKDSYPMMYCFSSEKWYYFMSGSAPDRVFWDYQADWTCDETAIMH